MVGQATAGDPVLECRCESGPSCSESDPAWQAAHDGQVLRLHVHVGDLKGVPGSCAQSWHLGCKLSDGKLSTAAPPPLFCHTGFQIKKKSKIEIRKMEQGSSESWNVGRLWRLERPVSRLTWGTPKACSSTHSLSP